MVFEAIGDDKVRVTCASWDDARIILADQALAGRTHYAQGEQVDFAGTR